MRIMLMDKGEMLMQLQDLKFHCSEFASDNETFAKDVEALEMAIGLIFEDMLSESKISEQKNIELNPDLADKITVRNICKEPDNIKSELYLHLVWQPENPDEPMLEPIWEGYITDIPEEYMDYKVENTGRSMKDFEMGVDGFYIYCKNEIEVEITETLQKRVKINAKNDEAALDIANEKYKNGEIILTADDCVENVIFLADVVDKWTKDENRFNTEAEELGLEL